jgi:hopene-associated glycosyltransferase HpnB
MHITLIAGGVLSLAAWVYLLFARGSFWRISRPQPAIRITSRPTIAVVIPARNESDVIARAITSLLHQQIDASLHVVLVDDASTDSTAAVARQAAASAQMADSLTILNGKPLPVGWSGKVWAQQQGISKALEFNPDYLLLTDADIEHAPSNLANLVALAENNRTDLTSFMVKLHCQSWFERWLIPAFVFFFFMLYPPAWIRDRRRATAGAAGGCMLIRPAALAAAGGIESIRSEIIDDCALASAIKQTGGNLWLGPTETARSIRPYESVSEIGGMISRSAFNQLGHSTLILVGTIFGVAILYLLPIALLFSRSTLSISLGAATLIAMLVAFAPMVRFYRLNPLWTLALPAAALFYIGATIHSAIRYWSGTGGMWKGRAQDRSAVHSSDHFQV